MLSLKSSAARVKTAARRQAGTIQGVAGATCVAGGALIQWGPGWALLALGGFLLLGAWGSA